MNRFSLLTIFIIASLAVNAQWQQTNGPFGGRINCLTLKGTEIFTGTYYGGIFLSADNGDSWTSVNNGLFNYYVTTIAVSGSNIFAGTCGNAVFLSTDDGSSWNPSSIGLFNAYINDLEVSGTDIFAGT